MVWPICRRDGEIGGGGTGEEGRVAASADHSDCFPCSSYLGEVCFHSVSGHILDQRYYSKCSVVSLPRLTGLAAIRCDSLTQTLTPSVEEKMPETRIILSR